MLRVVSLVALLALAYGCGDEVSGPRLCPDPPQCRNGKLCGCACIERSKGCTKALEEALGEGARG